MQTLKKKVVSLPTTAAKVLAAVINTESATFPLENNKVIRSFSHVEQEEKAKGKVH